MAFPRIREAASPHDLAEVRRLFNTYAKSLGISLGFQNFDQELAGLPEVVWHCGPCKIRLAR